MATQGLNKRQERFCQEYLVDLNATQACIRAGYSPKTSSAAGARLLTNVKVASRLAELQKQREQKTERGAEEVLRKLWEIVDADPRIAFNDQGELLPPKELPQSLVPAISQIRMGRQSEVKLFDRLRALELIGKHFGMFVDRVQATVQSEAQVQIYLPDNGREDNTDTQTIDGEVISGDTNSTADS